ncbi:MAG TPA: DUF2335 domain-containing protein [bacterium]|nr:DUF2335 domain-containing protein [bacterium]
MPEKQENSPDDKIPNKGSDRSTDSESASQEEPPEVLSDDQDSEHLPEDPTQLIAAAWRGQYPHPRDLREYEEIHEGFTDRLLTMTEAESEHRRALQTQQVEAGIEHFSRGQWFAFILGTITVLTGGATAIFGNAWAGGLIGISAVAGIVTAFLRSASGRGPRENKASEDQSK